MIKKYLYKFLFLLLVLPFITCTGYPDITVDDPEQIFVDGFRKPLFHIVDYKTFGDLAVEYIKFFNDNFYSRKPFSYREKETAEWLVDELLAIGHPLENILIQEFTVGTSERWWRLTNQLRWRSEFPLRRTTQLSQNIILTVPGQSKQIIIVGAHYDTYPVPGATDNASGISLLLESIQRILLMENFYTIIYVFFGAEELGLDGSDYFVNNMTDSIAENVILMINADNLFEGPYVLYGAVIETDGLPDENELTLQIDKLADELDLGLIRYPGLAFLQSDQLPFLMNGYTVVSFAGLDRTELLGVPGFFILDDYMYMRTVSHTQSDCYHYIESRWPGMIKTNMFVFATFLNYMLLLP